jgi:ribosome-associated protein
MPGSLLPVACRLLLSRGAPIALIPAAIKKLAVAAAQVCEDKKATDIKLLEVAKLTTVADYFVVCSVSNERQGRAIADELRVSMKAEGQRELSVEGIQDGRWILQDFGAVVVHVFLADHRNFYDLEGLWADAKQVRWKSPAPAAAAAPKAKKPKKT